MKRSLKIGFIALLVSLPLLMAPSGGLPSRPTFQTVVIRSASNPQLTITGSTATATNLSGIRFNNSAGTRVGYAGDLSSGDSDFYVGTDLASSNVRIDPGSGGSVFVSGSAVRNAAYQRVAYGQFGLCTTGTCTPIGSPLNLSVAWTSTGNYTMTLSAGFTVAPVCVASGVGNGVHIEMIASSATTTSYNFAAKVSTTLTDSGFTIQCFGT